MTRYRPRTPRKNSDDHEVGYKKPPKSSQFKKGQSGNPKGRPKNSKNANKHAHDVFNEAVSFTENGEAKTTTRRELAVRTQADKALKGDHRAADRMFSMDDAYQARQAEQANEARTSTEDMLEADRLILERYLQSRMGEPDDSN